MYHIKSTTQSQSYRMHYSLHNHEEKWVFYNNTGFLIRLRACADVGGSKTLNTLFVCVLWVNQQSLKVSNATHLLLRLGIKQLSKERDGASERERIIRVVLFKKLVLLLFLFYYYFNSLLNQKRLDWLLKEGNRVSSYEMGRRVEISLGNTVGRN